MSNTKKRLSNQGRFGVLLIFIGVLMAIDAMANLAFVYKLWPLLIMLLGIGFCGIYVHRARREAIYIGIGAYLIGVAGIFLYCTLVSWKALSLLWPGFITLLGLAFCIGYFQKRQSPKCLLIGLLLISISAVFFFVFSVHYQLWWTVFFLAGASFLLFDKTRQVS